MFVSPTEPEVFRKEFAVSLAPEEYGVDFMWQSKLGLIGVQRKEFPGDFLASVEDGRLNREYAQMKALDVAVLLLEGRPQWTMDGKLIRNRNGKRTPWDLDQHRNYLASVQMRGIQVHTSGDHQDTLRFIRSLRSWTNKKSHTGLDHRPAAQGATPWGSIANDDYVRYLYQSLPGINTVLARAIYEELGMIFHLNVSADDLMEVPGIGPGRANKIIKVFEKREQGVTKHVRDSL